MDEKELITTLLNHLLYDLSEGNPGAITVLKSLMKEAPEESFMILEKLEKHQIKGSDLWVLFKQNQQDIHTFVNYVKTLD